MSFEEIRVVQEDPEECVECEALRKKSEATDLTRIQKHTGSLLEPPLSY